MHRKLILEIEKKKKKFKFYPHTMRVAEGVLPKKKKTKFVSTLYKHTQKEKPNPQTTFTCIPP